MATTNFDKSFKNVLKQEGGYVDHPKDSGGATNKGITLKTLSEYRGAPASKEDLKSLTDTEIRNIYQTKYWNAISGSQINDPEISNMIFDQYVNKGTRVKGHVQSLLGLPVDGVIGPDTINKLNGLSSQEKKAFKESFIQRELEDYTRLVETDPDLVVFYNGWMKRLSNLAKESGVKFTPPNLKDVKSDRSTHKAYFKSDFVPDAEDLLEAYDEIEDLRVKPGYFRFNDLVYSIPPESINILTSEFDQSILLLRTEVPVSIQEGRKRIRMVVNFPVELDTDEGKSFISRMIIQIRKTPIATIDNEKIRKELFGTGSTMTNIGVVVDNINGYIDEDFPNLLRCTLQMSWFNHIPYVDEIKYVEALPNGQKIYKKYPSKLYEKFYKEGTFVNNSYFINDLSVGDQSYKNLVILYKEYAAFDNVFTYQKPKDTISRLESGRKIITPENYVRIKELEKQGWYIAEDQERHEDMPIEGVFYRWKSFEIPYADLAESGGLFLQNMSFSLSTNPSYISMEQYGVPTVQFLGGSTSEVRAMIFADAEKTLVNDYTKETIPSGTSNKLAKLQGIFRSVSEDRARFPKFSKENHLLIAHPIAKLMKYKTDNLATDLNYYNEEGVLQKFNANLFLPVVVANTASSTVTGLPYASRYQIDFKETRFSRNQKNIKFQGESGSQNNKNVYRKIVEKLVSHFDIKYNSANKQYSITNIKSKSLNKENYHASKIVVALNNLLKLDPEATTLDKAFSSEFFYYTMSQAQSAFKSRLGKYMAKKDIEDIKTYQTRTPLSSKANTAVFEKNRQDALKRQNALYNKKQIKVPEFPIFYFSKQFVISDFLLELYIDFIKALQMAESWPQNYIDEFEEYVNYEPNGAKDLYKDMMIPTTEESPAFYFADGTLRINNYKNRIIKNLPSVAANADKIMADKTVNMDPAKEVGTDLKKGKNNFPVARNMFVSDNNKDKGLSSIHNPNDQTFRVLQGQKAVANMTPYSHSLSQVYPTFQVQLFSDRYNFLQKYSAEDINAKELFDEEEKDLLDIFDLSSIIDLRIIKDEHEAADVMVIRVLNTNKYNISSVGDPVFDPNMFSVSKIMSDIISGKSTITKTYDANLTRSGLKEGIKIKALLGYSASADNLTVEFSGRIAAINGSDIIEIYAVGNGHELIQNTLGLEKYSLNSDTTDLIAKLLEDSKEVKSFGNTGLEALKGIVVPSLLMWGGRSALENIYAPTIHPSGNFFSNFKSGVENAALKALVYVPSAIGVGSMIPFVGPIVSGAAAAGIAALGGGIIGALALAAGVALTVGALVSIKEVYTHVKNKVSPSKFVVFQQTIWDVLQELTLRHPGYICSVVSFDNRSTLYFGEPDNPYFFRGPQSTLEKTIKSLNTGSPRVTMREIADAKSKYADMKLVEDIDDPTMVTSNAGAKERIKTLEEKRKDALKSADIEMLSLLNMQKNFRTYHLVTSEHDIISNQIEASSMDVANSVQVYHPSSSSDAVPGNGQQYVDNYELTDPMKADDDLYSHLINNKIFTFHNAHEDSKGLELPQRYAKAILCKELEKIYKGKIVILGRPGIKPHDILILRDTYNQMSGPVGVAKVSQILAPSEGWITVIYPKFIAIPDTSAGAFQMSNVLKAARYLLADEAGLFYTSMQKFNPTENTGSNKKEEDFARSWDLTFGSPQNSFEKLELDDDEKVQQWKMKVDKKNISLASGVVGQIAAPQALESAKLGFEATKAAAKGLKTVVSDSVAAKNVGGLLVNGGSGLFNVGAKASTTLLKGGTGIAAGALGVVVDYALESATEGFINWSKYREPIYIFPLKKDGTPFMAGLNGFKENTLFDHLLYQVNVGADKMGAMAYYVRDFFNGWVGEAPVKSRISSGEKIVTIKDGDSIVLDTKEELRLAGYDSAETHPNKEHIPDAAEIAMGEEAQKVLDAFVKANANAPVTVERKGVDRYQRTMARISLGDQDVSDYLINYRSPNGGQLVFIYNGEPKYDFNNPDKMNNSILRNWENVATNYFGKEKWLQLKPQYTQKANAFKANYKR